MKETVSDRERSSESVIVENRYQYLWWKITLELQAERCVIDNTGEKNPKESRLSRCPPLYGACMKPRVEYTTNRWLRRAILVLFGRGFFYESVVSGYALCKLAFIYHDVCQAGMSVLKVSLTTTETDLQYD